MSANTVAVTDESFATDVLQAEGPVLVDFWAEWCGPCKMIAPALEEIGAEFKGKVTIAKVNIDEKLLTQIATETGGKYYRAKDNESLHNIYSEIDQLEKSRIEVSPIRRYTEQFFPFALAAAVFLFLELLLRWTVLRKFP